MGWVAANLLIGHQQPVLMGNDNFTAAPSGTFATKDGYINIAANKQEQWEAVADVLGVPELKTDPALSGTGHTARRIARRSLRCWRQSCSTSTTEYWVEVLNKNDVPSGAILGLEEALNQEQVKHRDTFEHPCRWDRRSAAVQPDGKVFERPPGTSNAPPPSSLEHTEEIMKDLGYSEGEIKALKQTDVM